ncbi:MAG: hypothetical protein JO142_02295 [Burkholderiales bacterium]|nr:hypothetical protein [Burkholderiales bacterium]
MDRVTVYSGQVPLETHILNTNRNTMIALGKLAGAISFGATQTSTPQVNNMPCTTTQAASMNVLVGPGEVYQASTVDNTQYGTLPADTLDWTVKQGILLQPVTLPLTAPATAGYSINYLIEVAFNEQDTNLSVLQYYNSANPIVPYSGPGNNGQSQPTTRQGLVAVTAKAGVAAPTGTQVTPTPDPGYAGLYVVTVTQGQVSLTSSNIAVYASAPFLYQQLSTWNAAATYPANAYVQSGGQTYHSLVANFGQNPASSPSYWEPWGWSQSALNAQISAAISGAGNWTVITTNTTAANNTSYAVNTSGGAVTLTLPASPSNGQVVPFMDAKGTFATNNLTVAQGSTATIMGLAQSMVVSTPNVAASLVYIAALNDWRLK